MIEVSKEQLKKCAKCPNRQAVFETISSKRRIVQTFQHCPTYMEKHPEQSGCIYKSIFDQFVLVSITASPFIEVLMCECGNTMLQYQAETYAETRYSIYCPLCNNEQRLDTLPH